MSRITISRASLEALPEYDEEDVRTDYSGRSMYGGTCLGYTGSDIVLFTFHLAVELVRADMSEDDEEEPDLYAVEEKLGEIGNGRSDSMGRGVIFYWPHVTVSS